MLMLLYLGIFVALMYALTLKPSHYQPDCSKSKALFGEYVGASVLAFYDNKQQTYNELTKAAKKLILKDHLCYSDAIITWAVGN